MGEQSNQMPPLQRYAAIEQPYSGGQPDQTSTSDGSTSRSTFSQTLQESEPGASEEITKATTLLFEHVEGQITLADTKAQLTLAADALLAGTIVSLGKGVASALLDGSAPVINRLVALFTVLMFLALVCSFFYALRVVGPYLQGSERLTLMYFGQIAPLNKDDFIHKFLGQSLIELKESMLTEVYAKAKIAQRKFTRVRWSINFLIAALVSWAIVQLLLAFL